jgi:hypothetical protein
LYSTVGSNYPTTPTGMGDAQVLLAPPPGDQYPLLVYSESIWSSSQNRGSCQPPGLLWAFRGSPPGMRAYGAGTASPGLQPPVLGMRDLSGPPIRFHLSDSAPGAFAVLMLGWSDQSIGGVPLPLSLSPWGLPGISLLTSTQTACFVPAGTSGIASGYARLDATLPIAATGIPLYAQWLWVDPANPSRHGSTAGHRLLVR